MAGPTGKAESATASCVEVRSGQTRDAVAPVDGADLEGFDAVVLRRVLQVREQRLRLVGGADLEVLADGEVVDRGEEDRVAHDAGDRVNDKLVRAGAVDDAGAARVGLAVAATVAATVSAAVTTAAAAACRGGDGLGGDGLGSHLVGTLGGGVGGLGAVAVTTAAAAARRGGDGLGGDGLGGHLVGALGRGVVSAAAATGVLSGGLGGLGGSNMAVTMAVSATVATAAAAALLGGLRSGGLGGSGLLGALLLTLATAAATAAAVLGRDGVGVDQLEHLTVSHVFSLSSGPQGHFGKPHTV